MVNNIGSFESISPQGDSGMPQSTSPYKALAQEAGKFAAEIARNLKKKTSGGHKNEEIYFEKEVRPKASQGDTSNTQRIKLTEVEEVEEEEELVLARQSTDDFSAEDNPAASDLPQSDTTQDSSDEDMIRVTPAQVPGGMALAMAALKRKSARMSKIPKLSTRTASVTQSDTARVKPSIAGGNNQVPSTQTGGDQGNSGRSRSSSSSSSGDGQPGGSGGPPNPNPNPRGSGGGPGGGGGGGGPGPGGGGGGGAGSGGGGGAPPPPPPPPPDPYKPTTPIMGDVRKLGKDNWGVLLGGKPLPDWTGLEQAVENNHPNNWRYPNSSSESKNYKHRCEGVPDQLQQGKGDLKRWLLDVSKKLKDNGLDTIAHLQDPDDSDTMLYILTHFQKYKRTIVKTLMKDQVLLYDKYDLLNDQAAQEILLNSLEPTFRAVVRKDMTDDDTFNTLFIKTLALHIKLSFSYYEGLINKVKTRYPQAYGGENVKSMVQDNDKDCDELMGANCFEARLLLHLVINYRKAGGNDPIYLRPLEDLEMKLRAKLERSNWRDKQELFEELKDEGLFYQDIGEIARTSYEERVAENEWLPAKRIIDRQGLPRRYAANMAEGSQTSKQAEANQLTQLQNPPVRNRNKGQGQRDLSDVECFVCHKKGHYARDCPQNKNKSGKGNQKGPKGRGNQGARTNKHKKKDPKRTPPGPGDPEDKMFNGTMHHWCKKCGRFVTTHSTATHKKKSELEGAGAAVNTGIPEGDPTLVPDPCCWHADTSSAPLWDILQGFKYQVTGQCMHDGVPKKGTWILNIGLCLGVVILASLIVVSSVIFSTSVAEVVRSYLPALSPFHIPWSHDILWSILPVAGGALLGIMVYCLLPNDPAPAPDPFWADPTHGYSRREKRAAQRQSRKFNRRRWGYGSIRDHGLKPSYPRHHRSAGRYYTQPPTVIFNNRQKFPTLRRLNPMWRLFKGQ